MVIISWISDDIKFSISTICSTYFVFMKVIHYRYSWFIIFWIPDDIDYINISDEWYLQFLLILILQYWWLSSIFLMIWSRCRWISNDGLLAHYWLIFEILFGFFDLHRVEQLSFGYFVDNQVEQLIAMLSFHNL